MSVPPLTRLDAVLVTLAEVVTAALKGLDESVEVMDGPRLGELPWRHLMLGITDTPETAPYTATFERQEGLGAARYVEAWEVRCGLCLASGDVDALPRLRSEAADVLGRVDTALRAAHRTRGVWDDAAVGDAAMQWYPVPNADGSTVLVFFSLEGRSVL